MVTVTRRCKNGHFEALKQDIETGPWSDINALDDIDDSNWVFETLRKDGITISLLPKRKAKSLRNYWHGIGKKMKLWTR